jgi:hypothetical protein
MTIELAPLQCLVFDHRVIIPWSDLRKSRSSLVFVAGEPPALERSGRERGGTSQATKTSENKGREHLEGEGMITR